MKADFAGIEDFARYPELCWLNRHFLVPPVVLAVGLLWIGGWWALLWGFSFPPCSSGTAHSRELSGSSLWPAPLTARRTTAGTTGSSQSSRWAKAGATIITTIRAQLAKGFFWWEIDLSYYLLRVCEQITAS